jgi:FkbM family methyltransferase
MNKSLRAHIDRLTTRVEKHRAGRCLLSLIGSSAACLLTRRFVRIVRGDGCWFRKDDGIDLPLGDPLRLYSGSMRGWKPGGEEILEERRAWWFRYYQPQEGDLVADIGAGRGEDVLVFSKAVGIAGRIVAVEAHPATAAILKNFVTRNGIHNVEVHQLAAAEKAGTRFISDASGDDWQCASIVMTKAGEPTPAGRLDDIKTLREAERIAFLKMNIEGAEVEALRGATAVLHKTGSVCICCHDFLGEQTRTKSKVCQLLNSCGFQIFFSPPGTPPYESDFVYGTR